MNFDKHPGNRIKKVGNLCLNSEPVISIITPFYNGGKTLEETANSIFSQTYPYFEWIIVDDGSTDENSLSKLNDIEQMDNRVKVFHKKNGGPSQARDYGIKKSSTSTKYIHFLDCDDLIDNTMLEVMYWTLSTHPEATFVYSSIISFGNHEYYWEPYFSLEEEVVNNIMCINTMVKKNALMDVGCFGIKEKAMFEDWNLWLKLLAKEYIPIRINAPLFWYRVNNTGEFARANKNYSNAMKLINSTVKTIQKDVKAIQFPRMNINLKSKTSIDDMVLPKYDVEDAVLFLLSDAILNKKGIINYEIIKKMSSNGYKCYVITTSPIRNNFRQEYQEYADFYDLTNFLDYIDYPLFINYLIESRNISSLCVDPSTINCTISLLIKKQFKDINIIDLNDILKQQLKGTKSNDKIHCTAYLDEKNKKKYNIPSEKKVISFIERISYDENPLLFIDIANELLKTHNDLFFIMSGNGPMFNDIKAKIEEANLSKDILLLHQIDNDELYRMSNVVLSCPRKNGVSPSMYKAIKLNVPIVTNDVLGQGNISGIFSGQVVDVFDDKDSYVKAVEEIIGNESQYRIKLCIENEKINTVVNEFYSIFKKKVSTDFSITLLQNFYESYLENMSDSIINSAKVYYMDYLGLNFNGHSEKVEHFIKRFRYLGFKYNCQGELKYIFNYIKLIFQVLKKLVSFCRNSLLMIIRFIPFVYNIVIILLKFLNKKRIAIKRR